MPCALRAISVRLACGVLGGETDIEQLVAVPYAVRKYGRLPESSSGGAQTAALVPRDRETLPVPPPGRPDAWEALGPDASGDLKRLVEATSQETCRLHARAGLRASATGSAPPRDPRGSSGRLRGEWALPYGLRDRSRAQRACRCLTALLRSRGSAGGGQRDTRLRNAWVLRGVGSPCMGPDDVAERFERALQAIATSWRRVGIDTRGISSGAPPYRFKVEGWIVADGSRGRFNEVVQKLGPTQTVEQLILREDYRELFSDRVRAAARERLESTVHDRRD